MNILRAPDWRWQQATEYIAMQNRGLAAPEPSDPLVHLCIRLQKASIDVASRKFMQLKLPELWQVCSIGTAGPGNQMRCQIQAHLLQGILSTKQLSQKIKWFTIAQVALYRDIFFDISDYKHMQAWVQRYLLRTGNEARGQNKLYRTRYFAYKAGADVALASDDADAKRVRTRLSKDFVQNRVQQRIFDYMSKQLNLDPVVYSQLMQGLMARVDSRQLADQLRKSQQGGSTTLAELADGICQNLKKLTARQQATLTQSQKLGQDDVNLYIEDIKNNN